MSNNERKSRDEYFEYARNLLEEYYRTHKEFDFADLADYAGENDIYIDLTDEITLLYERCGALEPVGNPSRLRVVDLQKYYRKLDKNAKN